MLDGLNTKFNQFGVYIERVNVMNVIIPPSLRGALYEATTFDVLLLNQVKANGNIILRVMIVYFRKQETDDDAREQHYLTDVD
jgi:hypothetical protein